MSNINPALPDDLLILYRRRDDLMERIDSLNDELGDVERQIEEQRAGDWTAYRDCVSGEVRRSRA